MGGEISPKLGECGGHCSHPIRGLVIFFGLPSNLSELLTVGPDLFSGPSYELISSLCNSVLFTLGVH